MRQPPSAGPRVVEWIATIPYSPERFPRRTTSCSWSSLSRYGSGIVVRQPLEDGLTPAVPFVLAEPAPAADEPAVGTELGWPLLVGLLPATAVEPGTLVDAAEPVLRPP
jgi:hypothetical protein